MQNDKQKKDEAQIGAKKTGREDRPLNDFATLQAILRTGPSHSDPDGMYTGRPIGFDIPIQDGDDL